MFGESSSSFAFKPRSGCFEDISFYKRFRDNNPALYSYNPDPDNVNHISEGLKRLKHQAQIVEVPNKDAETETMGLHNRFLCEVCNVYCSSAVDFQTHVSGKRHAHAVSMAHVLGKTMGIADNSSKKVMTEVDNIANDNNPNTSASNIANGKDPNTSSKNANADGSGASQRTLYCPECAVHCSGEANLEAHIKGKKHAKKVQSYVIQSPSFALTKNEMLKNAFDLNALNMDDASNTIDGADKSKLGLGIGNSSGLDLDVYKHSKCPSPNLGCHISETAKEETSVKLLPSGSMESEDLYCKVCHVYSNSLKSYEAHIAGKKHLRACQKANLLFETGTKIYNPNVCFDNQITQVKEKEVAQSDCTPLKASCVFEKEKAHPVSCNANHAVMELLKPHIGSQCCIQSANLSALNGRHFREENYSALNGRHFREENHGLDVPTCLGLGVSNRQQDEDDEKKFKQLISSLITTNAPDCVISALMRIYDADSVIEDAGIRCYSCCNDDTLGGSMDNKVATVKMHTKCFLQLVKSLLMKRQL